MPVILKCWYCGGMMTETKDKESHPFVCCSECGASANMPGKCALDSNPEDAIQYEDGQEGHIKSAWNTLSNRSTFMEKAKKEKEETEIQTDKPVKKEEGTQGSF